MIPFAYLLALVVSLIVVIYNIRNIYYPTKLSTLQKVRNLFISFILPYLWVIAFCNGNYTFLSISLGIISGFFGAYLYLLFGDIMKDEDKENNNEENNNN